MSCFCRYLVRPSPFSAQKTFERHNSRRKSNISFCSNINLAAAAAGSRRGSGIGLNQMGSTTTMTGYGTPRAPPLGNTKSNSLSLPDSPNQLGQARGRSNSLRVSLVICFVLALICLLSHLETVCFALALFQCRNCYSPSRRTSHITNVCHSIRRSTTTFYCAAQILCDKVYQTLACHRADESHLSKRLA